MVISRHMLNETTPMEPADIDALPAPSTYTRILLQRAPDQVDLTLQGTGLTQAAVLQMPTVTVAQQLRVLRNVMAAVQRDDWALEFGRQLNTSSHGPLGFAALSAPTLGEALEVFSNFARIRAPYVNFHTKQVDQQLLFQVDTSIYPLGTLELPLLEIMLQIVATYVEAVLGRGAAEARLMIALPRPKHVKLYGDYFRSPCEFDAPMSAYALPASLMHLPCPLHDEKTYRTALIDCREALDKLLSPHDVVTRVENLLASHFDRITATGHAVSLPRLEASAQALCVSPRTLIRQLAEHGTSFRKLLEHQQCKVACHMLGEARYTAHEIGALLGYGDAASFGRAFRRLTGMSPGQYRRREQ